MLAPVYRVLFTFQRRANAQIGREMRAIRDGRTTGALASALLLAFAYGVVHAIGPGHGKVVVTTYFLSREARIGCWLLMGAQMALMHVVSAVIVVAFADLLLTRTFGGLPAEIPAVRLGSYVMILGIGLVMLRRALVHGHRHGPHTACGCTARHSESGLLSLGVGLVPCTGAVLILLYALANDILWAGLAMVVAIAVGMALTMGALGLMSVMARRYVLRPAVIGSRGAVAVDILGAGVIILFGTLLLVTALLAR